MREVVFVSSSTHKGILRCAAVLDRYARRIGAETWATSITQEGLDAVRAALARVCTRQVGVTCFWKTAHGLERAWSMGKTSHVQSDGSIPVHMHRRPVPPPSPAVRARALLAHAAGLAHDLGKASQDFQNKLGRAGAHADPIRHEWLSTLLLEPLLAGESWEKAWAHAGSRVGSSGVSARLSVNTVFGRHPDPQRPKPTLGRGRVEPDMGTGIARATSALAFLVATHHRLPSRRPGASREAAPCLDTFFSPKAKPKNAGAVAGPAPAPAFAGNPERELRAPIQKMKATCQRLERFEATLQNLSDAERADFWFAQTLLARPALILADHECSSMDRRKFAPRPAGSRLFANTRRGLKQSRGELNQLLEWHLGAVGTRAGELVRHMHQFSPPGLSAPRLEGLLEPAGAAPYLWQNTVASHLAQQPQDRPTLMLNLAGTGRGKTRMNLRALAQINPEDRPFRAATALNLRSLTLQTIDAYREELELAGEIAGVIGDRKAQQLHMASKAGPVPSGTQDADEDGNAPEDEFIQSPGHRYDGETPEWLAHALNGKGKEKMRDVLLAPIVACTTDFLVTAGDLPKQGNQAVAMMRLMQSDLVLDEVDSYEPDALVSVMRMVTLSALAGRNVVASSATLSEGCAGALFQAWNLGLRLRAAILKANGNGRPEEAFGAVSMFDHATAPRSMQVDPAHPPDFQEAYRAHLSGLVKTLRATGDPPRLAELLPVPMEEGDEFEKAAAWEKAVAEKAMDMHDRHQQAVASKRTSVGLVRVGRIRTAMALAESLAEKTDGDGRPLFRVACYHAGLTLIQRNHLERRLDRMLKRKPANGVDPLPNSPELQEDLKTVEGCDARFVLVATPVEEIGRDHDFDWAIIEPSSTQSIVQTAGRVNRHRQIPCPPDRPNIAILEFNRGSIWPGTGGTVFGRPGLDVNADDSYAKKVSERQAEAGNSPPSNPSSMRILLDWPASTPMVLDAGLKFEQNPQGTPRHLFAELDNTATHDLLKPALPAFGACPQQPLEGRHAWGCADFYRDYVLRKKEEGMWEVEFEVKPTAGSPAFVMHFFNSDTREPDHKDVQGLEVSPRPSMKNDWLVLSPQDAEEARKAVGLSVREALSVSVSLRDLSGMGRDEKRWHESFGMGPRRKPGEPH